MKHLPLTVLRSILATVCHIWLLVTDEDHRREYITCDTDEQSEWDRGSGSLSHCYEE